MGNRAPIPPSSGFPQTPAHPLGWREVLGREDRRPSAPPRHGLEWPSANDAAPRGSLSLLSEGDAWRVPKASGEPALLPRSGHVALRRALGEPALLPRSGHVALP